MSLRDELVPGFVPIEPPCRDLPVELDQAPRHVTGLTAAHLPVVDLDDRDELGGGSGEEQLVGEVEVAARQRLLPDLDAFVARERHDRVAGDAGELTVDERRGDEQTVEDGEDVRAGTLGDPSVRRQHDRLVVAGLERGDLGERRVDVLPGRLARRRDGVVADALPARDVHPAALLCGVGAEVGAPRPAGDRGDGLARQGVEPHLAVTEVEQWPDVALVDLVDPDELFGGFDQLLRRPRRLHEVQVRRPEEPVDVLGQPEDRGATVSRVRAHALEDAPPVVEGGVEDVDRRVVPVDELAVHPDLLGGRDRHRRAPVGGVPSVSQVSRPVTASPISTVDRLSPVDRPARSAATAPSTRRAASARPTWSSSIPTDRLVAVGSAVRVPAMSGALPWTGSNMLGAVPSTLRLPLAARPMPPAIAAPRSVTMSPNRLSVTTTSNRCGWLTK